MSGLIESGTYTAGIWVTSNSEAMVISETGLLLRSTKKEENLTQQSNWRVQSWSLSLICSISIGVSVIVILVEISLLNEALEESW